MKIKKSLLISFLFVMCHTNNYGHDTKEFSSQCNGKVAKERPSLFVQAERCEQNLITARAQCLQINNCATNQAFLQAQNEALYSVIMLIDHLDELETKKDERCIVCERTETIDIMNSLRELLKTTR